LEVVQISGVPGLRGVIDMKRENNEPRYVISVAAKILGIQTHTLRYYERVGIVEPSRSRGNIRPYSEKNLDHLRHVKSFIEELGANLPGQKVILVMVQQIAWLQARVQELEEELKKDQGGE
jgi:MerR family transcriptional regulator, heat shock protein HspR